MEIKEKYKELELLVTKTLNLVKEKEQEIASLREEKDNEILALKAQIKLLESENRVNKSAQETVNALTEWKDVTTSVLKKLYLKIDKEIMRIEAQVATPKVNK